MRVKDIIGKLAPILFVLCTNLGGYSQSPQGFSYQAVVRDGTGKPIANQTVGLRITLLSAAQVSYYSETHTPKTSELGVISVVIGAGTLEVGSSTFSSIPWKNGDVLIKIEIDPTGGTNYTTMGTPSKLQSVPYALFAENAKEVVSQPTSTDDEPIFVVKNKAGQIVFAVYQTGVRVYVEDSPIVKGAKGGFAVGGLSNQAKGSVEYFRITSDSARIFMNETPGVKGAKGGFAVGGLSNQAKSISRNLMFVATDSTRFYIDESIAPKGAKGGFAVGGLSNQAKGTKPNEFMRISRDSARIYVGQTLGKGAKGGFAVGGLSNQSKGTSGNFLDLTPQNSFIGQDAGKSNTTGEQNAFIGYQAGLMNSDGVMNVFIGNESGLSNTSGSSNIFLGSSSGKNNSLGGNNIFLGTNSGAANTTGVSNIAIGTYAGQSLTTGLKNIFIGVEAGFSNSTGLDNVFIGNFAGNLNTASSNVFIGRTSGLSNTIGTNNVFVGEQTGRFNEVGSGNVFLGDQAGISEMGSNKLYIANSSTTAPLIYGEFDKGKIEINGSVKLKELINLKPSTTYPGNPVEGDVFYDATNHVLKYYNGTTWMQLSATVSVSTPFVSTVSIPPLTILALSCVVNCNISNQGGSAITQSGVRYSLTPFFDIPSTAVALYSTPGVGDFNVTMTGLIQNRLYYVRAFATNSQGTSLGNMMTFTTPKFAATPTITTNPVGTITKTTAISGGNVTLPGGRALTALGICWNTSSNPTISNNFTSESVGLGSFTSNLTGLTASTTYYVRAYATNDNGTAYGNEVVFATASDVSTVSDIDGNSYNAIQIGTQTWMKENLKTTKYRDGSNIPNITDNTTWTAQTSGAYCWYGNDAATNKNTYGALYNYYAVVDSRNLCPTGWHVPSDAEWTTLTNYWGGEAIAGGKLKEAGTIHWFTPNTGADNSSGFTALPAGMRYAQYDYDGITIYGEWWTSTEYDAANAWARDMGTDYIKINRYGDIKNGGFSVRCLKDQ